jgi:sulfoxide reductase heme-binding subunit YedZ
MRYIRTIIYILALDIALAIEAISRLHQRGLFHPTQTQWYGLAAVVFLYFSLLPSPLYLAFPNLPGRQLAMRSKKAFGISAFFFALLHSIYGWMFFGSFYALSFWGTDEIASLIIGLIALVLLAILAVTSIKRIKRPMGPWWKPLHRLVYLIGFLTYVHVVTITIHLTNIPSVFALAFVPTEFLLILQAIRFHRYWKTKHPRFPAWASALCVIGLSAIVFWSFFLISHHRH